MLSETHLGDSCATMHSDAIYWGALATYALLLFFLAGPLFVWTRMISVPSVMHLFAMDTGHDRGVRYRVRSAPPGAADAVSPPPPRPLVQSSDGENEDLVDDGASNTALLFDTFMASVPMLIVQCTNNTLQQNWDATAM